MRIGLDIDGVVADFTGHINHLYVNWFGEECPIVWNEWTAYKASEHFPSWSVASAWADKVGLWETMPLLPGVGAGIDALLGQGHKLTFITARSGEKCIYQTEDWFYRNFERPFGFARRDLHVGLGGSKASIPCSIYVDDGPEELAALKAAGKSTIRFEQDWNKKVAATAVVKSWKELVNLIGSLES